MNYKTLLNLPYEFLHHALTTAKLAAKHLNELATLAATAAKNLPRGKNAQAVKQAGLLC